MAMNKDLIDLLRGQPTPDLLPAKDVFGASATALSIPSIHDQGLAYGPSGGYQSLRKHLAEWLTSFYTPDRPVSEDRICITGGASQNLACILQIFTDPAYTRNIWMVAPTYFLASRIFDDAGFAGRLRGVPEDGEGVDLGYLERGLMEMENKAIEQGNMQPKYKAYRPWRKIYKFVIYAVPTFSNPSTKVMSLRRREELVRLARQYDALVITDDVYDFLQWSPDPDKILARPDQAPALRLVDVDRYLDGGTVDEWGNAVSNGSFSKIVGPGVRTGWAEGTAQFAYGLSQAGSSRSGGAPSQLAATFIDQLLITSALQNRILNELQPAYSARYHQALSSIREHLLPLGFTVDYGSSQVVGGYFIWLGLPKQFRADDLAHRAMKEENLIIASGHLFHVQDGTEDCNAFQDYVRISFAWEKPRNLAEGIRRLADLVRRATSEKATSSRI